MLKKALILILFLGGSCSAMESSQGMFLDFVSAEVATNLGEVKKNIIASAQCKESSFKEIQQYKTVIFVHFLGSLRTHLSPCLIVL